MIRNPAPVESKKTHAYEKMKGLDFLKQESPPSLDIIRQRMQGLRHEKLLRNNFDEAQVHCIDSSYAML